MKKPKLLVLAQLRFQMIFMLNVSAIKHYLLLYSERDKQSHLLEDDAETPRSLLCDQH